MTPDQNGGRDSGATTNYAFTRDNRFTGVRYRCPLAVCPTDSASG